MDERMDWYLSLLRGVSEPYYGCYGVCDGLSVSLFVCRFGCIQRLDLATYACTYAS